MSFLAVCQRSLRTSGKYCSKSTCQQKVALVGHQLHFAGYATNEPTGFGQKNQILRYPNIEGIGWYKPETLRLHNYKQVKYGDYVFKECAGEGFVHVYVQGYRDPREPLAPAGYGVCFGLNHPHNASGPVERSQNLWHSKLYGISKAINLVPKDLKIQKLCVCVNQKSLVTFVSESIPRLAENSFRKETGDLHVHKETSMEIFNLLRSRQDIAKLRIRYIPCHTSNAEMYQAQKIATKGAIEATKLLKYK